MDRFKVGIVGADTPQGLQLIKLLLRHPIVELMAVSPFSSEAAHANSRVDSFFPSLQGYCSLSFVPIHETLSLSDIVFCAETSETTEVIGASAIRDKCVFIDMGPSFLLRDEEEHKHWYDDGFVYPALHEAAVCGIPELFRQQMAGSVLVSVPSAAATAAHLALAPLVAEGLIDPEDIVIDAKLPHLRQWGHVDGELAALNCSYAVEPEINQLLSEIAGKTVHATLTTCRTSSDRGLMVTCTAKGFLSASERTILNAYNNCYANEPFVSVLENSIKPISTRTVLGTNRCEISFRIVPETGRIVVCAVLDDLMKGSSGQAVQCMNRVLSLPEEIGLETLPFN